MSPPWMRVGTVYCALCLVLCALAVPELAGCGRGRAQGLRPDLAGSWDLVYDDVIDVELRVGAEVHRARVGRDGGYVALHDAGTELALHIDCARPELVCPSEILEPDLVLTNRLGEVDDDGEVLTISVLGEGAGACRLQAGSLAEARIESHGSPDARSWRAVALSGGRALSVIPASCVMPERGDSKAPWQGARVRLSAGFSAVRR